MAPLTQYSEYDKRPRYYTAKQLEAAAGEIETRTQAVMNLQHQLLENWYRGSTLFQAAWRGFAARKALRKYIFQIKIKKLDRLFYLSVQIHRMNRERRDRLLKRAAMHIKVG